MGKCEQEVVSKQALFIVVFKKNVYFQGDGQSIRSSIFSKTFAAKTGLTLVRLTCEGKVLN